MRPGLEIQLSPRELVTIIILSALAGAPHLFHLKPWIGAFFVAMILLRLIALGRSNALPGRFLLFLLTLGGLANVLAHYPILLGKQAGVALLISMLGLKLMEMKQRRDVYVLVFLGYFVLVTLFLYQQGMPILFYVFVLVVGLTGVLVETSRANRSPGQISPFLSALGLLLQALPIMIVLFIFFPRFSSPLWHLGPEQENAVTGISDRISPGSISNLSRSRAVAFRVDFEGKIPAPVRRYWRGPVLWFSDGKEWTTGEGSDAEPTGLLESKNEIRYHITLEPTSKKWLFPLELPVQIPRYTALRSDYQLIRKFPIPRRKRYSMGSRLDYNTGPLTEQERSRGLQLPSNITPRMRNLVERWKQSSSSNRVLVDQALQHFRQQAFYYTLYPPQIEQNPADQFLFETRRGFCEHYATSFTLLMRLAGIPSRVVVGYQGGEINPIGSYLVVRQSDAHAWTEVWLQGRGWIRIDPTAAVAPERIEQSLNIDQIGTQIGAPILFDSQQLDFLKSLTQQIAWGVDALNASWHRWVLGYTRDRQSRLMELIGLGFLRGTRLAYGMVGFTALVVLILSIFILYRSRERRDPVQQVYFRFCRQLARKGMVRRPHEGPKDYGWRIIEWRPDLQEKVEPISRLYIGIRYGRMDSRENRKRLARLVRLFRP